MFSLNAIKYVIRLHINQYFKYSSTENEQSVRTFGNCVHNDCQPIPNNAFFAIQYEIIFGVFFDPKHVKHEKSRDTNDPNYQQE
jgi:hypothetical protein